MSASSGRRGRPWRKIRATVLAQSTICSLCGHPGAGEVHHDPPRQVLIELGLNPEDPKYLRPAHGWKSRCPVCRKACNQSAGVKADWAPPRTQSRAW